VHISNGTHLIERDCPPIPFTWEKKHASARGGHDLCSGFNAQSLGGLCRRHPLRPTPPPVLNVYRRGASLTLKKGRLTLWRQPGSRWLPLDGTHWHARHGTHQANQPGLPVKCSRNKSSRCSRVFQRAPFDHELVSRVGMQAGSGKATGRIHGIGRNSRNLWAFRPVCETSGVTVDPLRPRHGSPAPFAPRALPRFSTTMEQSEPNRCFGTFGLAGLPLVPFPLPSPVRFSSSVRKPGLESRLLCTGPRMASK